MKGSKKKRATPASKDAPAEPAVVEQVVQPEIAAEVAVAPQAAPAVAAVQEPVAAVVPDVAAVATVVLNVNCSVRDIIEFRNSLLNVVASETPVVIDAAQVERIDTAALQVLAAFVSDRRAGQREVTWAHVNEVLSEAARTLGLVAPLGIPDMQAGAA
jgi:anti-anti-sigma regulatory factor